MRFVGSVAEPSSMNGSLVWLPFFLRLGASKALAAMAGLFSHAYEMKAS